SARLINTNSSPSFRPEPRLASCEQQLKTKTTAKKATSSFRIETFTSPSGRKRTIPKSMLLSTVATVVPRMEGIKRNEVNGKTNMIRCTPFGIKANSLDIPVSITNVSRPGQVDVIDYQVQVADPGFSFHFIDDLDLGLVSVVMPCHVNGHVGKLFNDERVGNKPYRRTVDNHIIKLIPQVSDQAPQLFMQQ